MIVACVQVHYWKILNYCPTIHLFSIGLSQPMDRTRLQCLKIVIPFQAIFRSGKNVPGEFSSSPML
eukprot:Gb_22380 [translate_table: standard]